jgi:hypothetical protein
MVPTRQLEGLDGLSVASPIFPARPPSLLPSLTVELRLSQLSIDVVVSTTQPFTKLIATADSWRLPAEICFEVLRTHPAGIQLGEELDEAQYIRLLRSRW